MARELDFDSENFEQEAKSLSQSRPSFYKPEGDKVKRVLFLGRKIKVETVYDVNSQVEKDERGEKKYLGTFKALNSVLDGLGHVEIENLINSGDPDKKLRFDAKTLGRPTYVTGILMLVYPTDDAGTVNTKHFKNKVFELAWLKVSPTRYKELMRINNSLRAEQKKTIFDVDFKIFKDSSSAGKFAKIKLEAQPESFYHKHKKELKLDEEVETLVKAELDKYGLQHPADVVKFLASGLTEQGWAQVLQTAGYTVAGLPTSVTPPPTESATDTDVPSDPEMEDDLDL